MRRYLESEAFWLLLVCLIAAGVMLFLRGAPLYGSHTGSHTQKESARMLFVGDVMLARNVETLMDIHGTYYPFKGLRDMLAEYEAVIGNFEASIPERHVRTPLFAFKFSVAPRVLSALSRVGFTGMTLANNHSYDYGKEGYEHTREALADAGLMIGGDPRSLGSDEVIYQVIDGVQVAIIPINTIGGAPTLTEIKAVLDDVAEKSNAQIVSIHWGTEYARSSNESQRVLARALIDAGADAIIGHHPHVVQEIEEYRGAPIFYSLGNCIFDQYWNDDVQEGLSIAVSFAEKEMHFELIPLTSIDQKSAPRPMNRVERLQFLDTLAERSEQSLTDAIKEGRITELFVSSAESKVSE